MKPHKINMSLTLAAMLAFVSIAITSAHAQDPDNTYGYGYIGGLDFGATQDAWNAAFPVLCGDGVRQSPINIKTSNEILALLPPISFNYSVAHITELDHGDQIEIDHGAGNYITIGSQRFNLIDIHYHTPGEYTVNGQTFPFEFHFVHQNADPNGSPQLAVVGVFVNVGPANKGLIGLPSQSDPLTVDIDLSKLLPAVFSRNYWRFDGSLTTPGAGPTYCTEGLLWTVMKTPITMSQAQINAFEASSIGYWGTDVTNRPVQNDNGRYILTPVLGGFVPSLPAIPAPVGRKILSE